MPEVNIDEAITSGSFADVCYIRTYVVAQKYQRPQVRRRAPFVRTRRRPDPQSLANLKWFEVLKMKSCSS